MTVQCAKCSAKQNTEEFFCSACGFDIVTGTINSKETPDPAIHTEPLMRDSSDKGDEGVDELVSVSGSNSSVNAEGSSSSSSSTDVETQVVYSPPSTSPVGVKVSFSREFFERVVQNGEMLFPEHPLPIEPFEIVGDEIHVGRSDPERGISPDIDINVLTGDMAVSIEHAVIRVSANGVLTVTDLGSTNGTFLGSAFARPIKANDMVEFSSGSPIYLGAWTKVVISV